MKKLISLVLFLTAGLLFAGCTDTGGPDPKVEQVRLDNSVKMRELFNKAGGDYSKLDATDQAAFEKMAGGAGTAEQTWNAMKSGPSAASSTGPQG